MATLRMAKKAGFPSGTASCRGYSKIVLSVSPGHQTGVLGFANGKDVLSGLAVSISVLPDEHGPRPASCLISHSCNGRATKIEHTSPHDPHYRGVVRKLYIDVSTRLNPLMDARRVVRIEVALIGCGGESGDILGTGMGYMAQTTLCF